jgi:hypothetical protein
VDALDSPHATATSVLFDLVGELLSIKNEAALHLTHDDTVKGERAVGIVREHVIGVDMVEPFVRVRIEYGNDVSL